MAKYESKYNDPVRKDSDAVRAKKHLGQHFLKDESISKAIVDGLDFHLGYDSLIEVGPGMGVLTKYIVVNDKVKNFKVVEIDRDSVAYLKTNYPDLKVLEQDFLQIDLNELFDKPFAVIGNFPYNISTQILFKVLEYRDKVPEVVGMFQKEVAQRIAAPPGGRTYGITSVLLQAFYDIEYLFTVEPHVFNPPPKVDSAVIRLKRNTRESLPCDEAQFFRIVKTAFNQRRKTLNNALKSMNLAIPEKFKSLRAEVLSVEDFVEITNAGPKEEQ